MEDKYNSSPNGDVPQTTGLEFEFGDNSGEQLVFDTADILPEMPILEVNMSGVEQPSVRSEEFSLPDRYETDARYETQSFIDDPMQLSPTYIPRFTEVSEKYNANKARGGSELSRAVKEPKAPSVDPTSEADEAKAAPHVVISSSPQRDEVRDESMLILKFDEDEKEVDPLAAEEAEVEALKSVVIEAARPEAEPEVEEEAPQEEESEPEPEAELPEEPVAEEENAHDPFAELVLVDYSVAESGSEAVSAEEAPSEVTAAGHFGEFTKPSQQDSIKDRFLDHLMSVKIRLVGALVLLAVMVVIDVLALFSVDILALIGLGNVTYAAAVVDLQFSVCLALFALPEIVRGVRNLFSRTVSPELVIPVSLALVILHSVTVMVTHVSDYPTFGILVGIQVVLAILASYHRVSADFSAFKLVSRNTVKSILDKRLTRTLPLENLALDGAVDEYNSKIARMFRTAFISDFFSRSSVAVENSFNNVLMLLGALGVSVTTALITWLVGDGGFADFTGSLAFVFLLAFPAFSMLIHKLPHHRSTQQLGEERGAFVGESSIYACSDIDVIAYDDTEIFSAEDVSIKKVHLYGKTYNAGKAMQQMYAIFAAVGGPLEDMFAASVDKVEFFATDLSIEDDGISAVFNGHSIAAGTLDYMTRHGMSIPEEESRSATPHADSTKVMYGAEDGEVYVKFFIRYSFSEEFTMLLPSLKSAGIVPLIYTRDPNLTADFFRMLTLGEDIIRVMKKYNVPDRDDKVYRRVSAGIVTLGDKLNAVNMVLLAKRYTAFQSALSMSELIAMLAGTAVAVLFAVTGSLGIPTVALAALQLVWCAYLYARTYYIFHDKKDKGND